MELHTYVMIIRASAFHGDYEAGTTSTQKNYILLYWVGEVIRGE
jgi:hypothetical protein